MLSGSLSSLRQLQGATVFANRKGDEPGRFCKAFETNPAEQICTPAPVWACLPFLALAYALRERHQASVECANATSIN
jgi:hypothetical protein